MPAWLGVIGGVIGLVVFFGSVVVYLAGSKDQGTIKTLQNSNAALQQRVEVLEDGETDLKARVDALEQENQMLKSQRPSADAIAALVQQTAHLDGRLDTHDDETKALILSETVRILEAISGASDG
jgi:cell division protein FtsB